jgi:hypothetical protein
VVRARVWWRLPRTVVFLGLSALASPPGAGNSETFAVGSTDGVAMAIGGQFTTSNDGTIVSEYAPSSAAGAQDAFATLPVSNAAINGGEATFRP